MQRIIILRKYYANEIRIREEARTVIETLLMYIKENFFNCNLRLKN